MPSTPPPPFPPRTTRIRDEALATIARKSMPPLPSSPSRGTPHSAAPSPPPSPFPRPPESQPPPVFVLAATSRPLPSPACEASAPLPQNPDPARSSQTGVLALHATPESLQTLRASVQRPLAAMLPKPSETPH